MSFVMNSAARDEPESTRKRRREETDDGDIDRRPFSIRQDSSDPFAKPRTFTPICLLSRSQLPLAYLDTAHDGSRIFTAHIQSLEAGDDESILIVEDQLERRMYAVERVQQRRYALCRLGEMVKMEDLMGREAVTRQPVQAPRKRRAVEGVEGGTPWWANAGIEADVNHAVVAKDGMPKLSMLRKQGQVPLAEPEPTRAADVGVSRAADESRYEDITSTTFGPAAAQDPLEELAKTYLDTLYLSRTPVAYFVKGPLARARAAFASQPAELVAFLRTAVLSVNVTDKKYRNGMFDHIKELPSRESPQDRPKKRKRKWKPKRDRHGFFVDEKDYLEQWWIGDDEDRTALDSAEKIDAVIRRRSQRIRSRETFLQVVLILEILALEASGVKSATASTAAAETQNLDTQAEESHVVPDEKKPKKKKDVDLSALLDNLLDRLVIWYSIASGSPAKSMDNVDDKEEANDDLKSFASEVIIPFFSARIHERANAASKKLGGPTQPHPSKSKASAPRRPGEPAVRQPPSKRPRKPLERVSSDALNRAGKRHPSLHRAATDSDVLSTMIKRENSETPPLDNIPMSRQKSQQNGVRKRPSLLESLARREVDLSAMSQATEAKLKKKAELEGKVRDAIDTLKKPNRSRAVEEHAKTTDESFAKAIAKGKSNGQRKTTDKNPVAVTATPRHVKATPAHSRHLYQGPAHFPSSGSVSMVPGTSARQLAVPDQIPNSTFAVPQTGHRPRHGASLVDGTPSRGFAKFMPTTLSRTPATLLESPTATRRPQMLSTPAKISRMPSLVEPPLTNVPGSSLKGKTYSRSKNAAVYPSTTDRREDSGIALNGDAALYNALGWDDDEYEELP
ncbi:hypothetical protein M409DRAFT_63702 [Zasmidium cellare ATCC 36951]|uniref:DNA replication regulator Sld3 C-terminal domain-containing protein n=1 Tax=Zasmidium cellare ATCC 36951 TaxID=1080233 RepID=A0A6A6CWL8_ZASCE|nr:uncharacterized protein M409DRAFT_63702 [Zasmidium cellare ATCC 36951]KAF2171425.1 hypothetical protein M409DRAFT_63702 [Zasmidium cellare ATCC 36951]